MGVVAGWMAEVEWSGDRVRFAKREWRQWGGGMEGNDSLIMQ